MKYAKVSLALIALASISHPAFSQSSKDYLYTYNRTEKAIKGGWGGGTMQWTTVLPHVEGLCSLASDKTSKRLFYLSDSGPDKGFLVIVDVSKTKASAKKYPLPSAYRDLSLVTYGPRQHLWMAYGTAFFDTYLHEFSSDGTNVHLSETLGRFAANGYSCISAGGEKTLMLSGIPLGNSQDFMCTLNVDNQYSDLIAVGYGMRSRALEMYRDKAFSLDGDGFVRIYEPGHYPWHCIQQHKCRDTDTGRSLAIGSSHYGYVLFAPPGNQSFVQCIDLDFLLASTGNNYGEVRPEFIRPYEVKLAFSASNLIVGPPPQITRQIEADE